ncbi:MAG: hypothetical protein ACK5LK_00180 [Chthoniobacterales bacterium]
MLDSKAAKDRRTQKITPIKISPTQKAGLLQIVKRHRVPDMSNLSSENWFLRKHEDKSVFGPVSFKQLIEWARSAQIAPHDMLSEDQEVWTKAPMFPELEMDWLVQLDDELFYGPTTPQAILEFLAVNEISKNTTVINCKEGVECKLGDCDFYPKPDSSKSVSINIEMQEDLEKRLGDLEESLALANAAISKLEARIGKLE